MYRECINRYKVTLDNVAANNRFTSYDRVFAL